MSRKPRVTQPQERDGRSCRKELRAGTYLRQRLDTEQDAPTH